MILLWNILKVVLAAESLPEAVSDAPSGEIITHSQDDGIKLQILRTWQEQECLITITVESGDSRYGQETLTVKITEVHDEEQDYGPWIKVKYMSGRTELEYPVFIRRIVRATPAGAVIGERIKNPAARLRTTIDGISLAAGLINSVGDGARETHGGKFLPVEKGSLKSQKIDLLREASDIHEKFIKARAITLDTMEQRKDSMDDGALLNIMTFAGEMVQAFESLTQMAKKEYVHSEYMMSISKKWDSIFRRLDEIRGMEKPGKYAEEETQRLIFGANPTHSRTANIYSLYEFMDYLYQRSFVPVFKLTEKTKEASISIKIADESRKNPEAHIQIIDAGERPLAKGEQITSELLTSLLESCDALLDVKFSQKLLLKNEQLFGHLQLGAHSAAIHAKVAEPNNGGMIFVEYYEWSTATGNLMRMRYLKKVMETLGLSVEMNEGALYFTARLDKHSGLKETRQIKRLLPEMMKLLTYTQDINIGFQKELERTHGGNQQKTEAELVDKAIQIYRDNGKLTVRSRFNSVFENFQTQIMSPERREAINSRLGEFGLASLSEEAPLTQRVIEAYVNRPIEDGLNRGELIIVNGFLAKKRGAAFPMRLNDMPSI